MVAKFQHWLYSHTCNDLEPTYVYEFAAAAAAAATTAAAAAAAAASAHNYIYLKFTLMQPTTMQCAFLRTNKAHDYRTNKAHDYPLSLFFSSLTCIRVLPHLHSRTPSHHAQHAS